MCKTFRNEELAMIFTRKAHCDMLPESRRPESNINCDVENFSLKNAYKLRLRKFAFLIMKSANNAVLGKRFVILDKLSFDAQFSKTVFVVGLAEVPASILKQPRLKNLDFGYSSINAAHFNDL